MSIINFKKVNNRDLVFLFDELLCTIDYDGDFEVEDTRENIRRIIKLEIEGEFARDEER